MMMMILGLNDSPGMIMARCSFMGTVELLIGQLTVHQRSNGHHIWLGPEYVKGKKGYDLLRNIPYVQGGMRMVTISWSL